MKGLCEYVSEVGAAWSGGLWAGDDSAAYADYVAATIHEDQLAEQTDISMAAPVHEDKASMQAQPLQRH